MYKFINSLSYLLSMIIFVYILSLISNTVMNILEYFSTQEVAQQLKALAVPEEPRSQHPLWAAHNCL